jgi:uncharacterized membrane protein YdbT with pleckstrin-like domain
MDQPQNLPETSRTPVAGRGAAPGENPVAFQQSDRAQAAPTLPEQDLWSGRMHWQNAIGRVIFWLLLNVVFVVAAFYAPRFDWLTQTRLVWTVVGLFVVTAVFFLGGVLVRTLQTHYRLTSQRLFIERGILSRTMDQTELIRVDDVRMRQSFVNRVFNIGTVLLMTTDVTDRSVAIVGIKDPIRVTELIRQQMRTLRGKSLFVENL